MSYQAAEMVSTKAKYYIHGRDIPNCMCSSRLLYSCFRVRKMFCTLYINFQQCVYTVLGSGQKPEDQELVEKGQRANQHLATVVLCPLCMSCHGPSRADEYSRGSPTGAGPGGERRGKGQWAERNCRSPGESKRKKFSCCLS